MVKAGPGPGPAGAIGEEGGRGRGGTVEEAVPLVEGGTVVGTDEGDMGGRAEAEEPEEIEPRKGEPGLG